MSIIPKQANTTRKGQELNVEDLFIILKETYDNQAPYSQRFLFLELVLILRIFLRIVVFS